MINVTDKIIDELTSRTGLPREQVAEAALSQFEFTAAVMKDDSFRTVHHQYLGKFDVNRKQLQNMKTDKNYEPRGAYKDGID